MGKYNTNRDAAQVRRAASIPIRVGRHVVGEVVGDTFKKRVRASSHFLRTPPAIAFGVSTLDDAERAGARYVEVTDTESGCIYRATIATIRARGFELNRGFGEQIALALNLWTCDDDADEPAQLSFAWGAP
jgi:hypothetical protein